MKRPYLTILIFLTIGIIAGRYADGALHIALFAVITLALAFAAVMYYGHKVLWCLVFAALLGFGLCRAAELPRDTAIYGLTGRHIKVSGSVSSVLYKKSDGTVSFMLDGMAFEDENGIINGRAKINVISSADVYPGDNVVVSGKLSSAHNFVKRNPSDFDRCAYMLSRHRHYSLYADKVSLTGSSASLMYPLQIIKERTRAVFYTLMPQKEASLMCAMLLGESEELDEDISSLYKITGIYHVIAISGLHITLLGAVLMLLFSGLGKRTGAVCTALVLACYCLLTGCSVSVVRAVIMFYIMLAGGLFMYDNDIVSSAAVSAFILLLYSPYYLFDAGFLLSFGAVFAIGFSADVIRRYKNIVAQLLCVDVGVELVTKPVLMAYFYYLSPWSIVANLVLVPLMSVVVALGFAAAAVGQLSLGAARLIAYPTVVILKSVESLCRVLASLPFAYTVTGKPTLLALAVYFALLAGVYLLLRAKRPLYALALTALGIAVMLADRTLRARVKPSVAFLYVGQGDCAVGRLDNTVFITDGGENGSTLSSYLMYCGINRVDAVFVSHTDSDHINGIIDIMGRFDIKHIYLPNGCDKNEKYYELMSLAKIYNVKTDIINKGNEVQLGEHYKMSCIYPYGKGGEGNNASMVCRLDGFGGGILFTGDIEKAVEERLCRDGADVGADILKLAHHGSKTSNTLQFIDRVKPKAAVASALKSAYGHPSEEVLSELAQRNIPCYVTENDGAITAYLSDGQIYITPYLGGQNERS